jgi:hypothetical protein
MSNNEAKHPTTVSIRRRRLHAQGSFWYDVYRFGFVLGTGLRWRAFHRYAKARQQYEKMAAKLESEGR